MFATILTVSYRARRLLRRLRPVWWWMRRHPRWTVLIAVLSWLIVSEIGGGILIATADDGSISNLPYLSALNPKDSAGVDLLHYATLPLQRGDLLHSDQQFIAVLIDTIWVAQIATVSWVLWLFEFLLSFQWVQWIAEPIGAILGFLAGLIDQIGWVPMALAVTAVVCGAVIMAGRIGTGVTEIVISVIAAALTATLLTNPMGLVTGPGGVLAWAENTGGGLAASIASDEPRMVDGATASEALSTTISAQLMDSWVRAPAQLIAFGKVLTDQCAAVFSSSMMAANPINRGDTSVRDAVAACDPAAGAYVNSPTFGQVATAYIISSGSGVLMVLGVLFAIVLVLAVLFTLFQAGKLVGATAAATMPGVARMAMWKSFIGIYVGGIVIAASVVLLSGFLRVVAFVMAALAAGGFSIVAQMFVIDLLVVCLAVALVYVWWRTHKTGESIAKRLARLGFGRGSSEQPHPVRASAKRIGEELIARRIARGPSPTPRRGLPQAPVPSGGAEPINLTATRLFRPTGGPGTATRTLSVLPTGPGAVKALTVGGQVAAAAATGGSAAVVMAVSKTVGGYVMQRAALAAGRKTIGAVRQAPGAASAGAGDAAAYTAYGRRIVVDRAGAGRIEPAAAPTRGGVHQITSVPRPRPPAPPKDSDVRRRLRAAMQASTRV